MEEPKDEYPWLTALRDEREKIIRDHQNRTIHFESPVLEVIFSCGVMVLGAGFFVSGFMVRFGTIEVGSVPGYLLGALLIYAGLLLLLSYGYDYGILSAFETVLARARERKDCTAAQLKEAVNMEAEASFKPIFSNAFLANFLGLATVIYGAYVVDLLLLGMLGISPATKIFGVATGIIFLIGGLYFFFVKEPFKRAKVSGFKRTLEVIRLSEHAPKPEDMKKTLEEEQYKAQPPLPSAEVEKIELHTLDAEEMEENPENKEEKGPPRTSTND